MPLNLYLVERPDKAGWDEFIAFVVAATDESAARHTDPCRHSEWNRSSDEWPVKPEDLKVTLIGTADPSLSPGIVLDSYRAG